jgi:WD40 repeat protein
VYRFESQLFGLSVSPVGDMLAIASPVGVYAYSGDPLSELWSRLHNLIVREVTFSPDGDILVSGDEDGLVTLWNANNGEEIVVLPSVIESVSRLAYAVDGNLLAAGGTGGIVSWQLPDRKQENFETNVNAVYGLALSPDSKTLASGTGITITLWDVDSGEQIHILEGQPEWGGVLDMAFSPDGSVLGAVFGEGIVVLWDAVSWEKISIFKGPSWAYELAYSPDSSVLAVGFYDSSVVLLDVVTGKQVGVLQGPLDWELWGAALYVEYFSDGNTIVAGYSENVLAFWNIESALVNP